MSRQDVRHGGEETSHHRTPTSPPPATALLSTAFTEGGLAPHANSGGGMGRMSTTSAFSSFEHHRPSGVTPSFFRSGSPSTDEHSNEQSNENIHTSHIGTSGRNENNHFWGTNVAGGGNVATMMPMRSIKRTVYEAMNDNRGAHSLNHTSLQDLKRRMRTSTTRDEYRDYDYESEWRGERYDERDGYNDRYDDGYFKSNYHHHDAAYDPRELSRHNNLNAAWGDRRSHYAGGGAAGAGGGGMEHGLRDRGTVEKYGALVAVEGDNTHDHDVVEEQGKEYGAAPWGPRRQYTTSTSWEEGWGEDYKKLEHKKNYRGIRVGRTRQS